MNNQRSLILFSVTEEKTCLTTKFALFEVREIQLSNSFGREEWCAGVDMFINYLRIHLLSSYWPVKKLNIYKIIYDV